MEQSLNINITENENNETNDTNNNLDDIENYKSINSEQEKEKEKLRDQLEEANQQIEKLKKALELANLKKINTIKSDNNDIKAKENILKDNEVNNSKKDKNKFHNIKELEYDEFERSNEPICSD